MMQKNITVMWKKGQWKSSNLTEKKFFTCAQLQGSLGKIKHTKIHIMGVPEEEDRDKGTENLFEEMMAKIIPTHVKEIDIQA